MIFTYLQKTSLQDFPDIISCIIFVAGCSFRCPMCYNSQFLDLKEGLISEEEIISFLEKRKGKLDGVVISGGEPLIYPEINIFLQKIRDLGYKIKIDTNGSNPENLKNIIDAKLVDYVAMDIKADKENYEKVAGVKVNLENIEKSMKILADAKMNGKIDYEFRTTLCPIISSDVIKEMSEKEIENIAKWIAPIDKEAKYYLQPFLPENGRLLDKRLENEKKTKSETLKLAEEISRKFISRTYIRA